MIGKLSIRAHLLYISAKKYKNCRYVLLYIEETIYLSQKIMVLTNKPTSVKTVLDNPLPMPRDVVSPEFVELRNKVTDLIKWW